MCRLRSRDPVNIENEAHAAKIRRFVDHVPFAVSCRKHTGVAGRQMVLLVRREVAEELERMDGYLQASGAITQSNSSARADHPAEVRTAAAKSVPQEGSQQTVPMKFCPQCGTQFGQEAKYCHECGQKRGH